jgi:hypothetical protein
MRRKTKENINEKKKNQIFEKWCPIMLSFNIKDYG